MNRALDPSFTGGAEWGAIINGYGNSFGGDKTGLYLITVMVVKPNRTPWSLPRYKSALFLVCRKKVLVSQYFPEFQRAGTSVTN